MFRLPFVPSFALLARFPRLVTKVMGICGFVNLDVMPGLGLACRFDSFDYIDSMVAQSLIPIFMSIILGLAYFFLACTSSKKSKEEEAYELPRNLRRKFTIKELRGLKTLFRHFDVDGGGFIDAKEMAALTKRLGLETTLLRSSSAASAAGDPESAPDQEGGEVDFKGFAELVIKSRKGPGGSKVDFFRLADELELEAGLAAGMADLEVPSALLGVFKEKELKSYRDIFRRFDRDGSGVIASKEIAELIRCLNPDLPKEELAATVRKFVAEVDEDGSGEVDFGEFLELMAKHKQGQSNTATPPRD